MDGLSFIDDFIPRARGIAVAAHLFAELCPDMAGSAPLVTQLQTLIN